MLQVLDNLDDRGVAVEAKVSATDEGARHGKYTLQPKTTTNTEVKTLLEPVMDSNAEVQTKSEPAADSKAEFVTLE